MYISSHTLGGLNFKVSVEVCSQRWIRLKFGYVTQGALLHYPTALTGVRAESSKTLVTEYTPFSVSVVTGPESSKL
jgi:hypothetical protein